MRSSDPSQCFCASRSSQRDYQFVSRFKCWSHLAARLQQPARSYQYSTLAHSEEAQQRVVFTDLLA
jgi:hypothetical protein